MASFDQKLFLFYFSLHECFSCIVVDYLELKMQKNDQLCKKKTLAAPINTCVCVYAISLLVQLSIINLSIPRFYDRFRAFSLSQNNNGKCSANSPNEDDESRGETSCSNSRTNLVDHQHTEWNCLSFFVGFFFDKQKISLINSIRPSKMSQSIVEKFVNCSSKFQFNKMHTFFV